LGVGFVGAHRRRREAGDVIGTHEVDVDDAREGLEVVSASKGAVATNSALNLGDAGTVDDGP
jgi:hypothetical protein